LEEGGAVLGVFQDSEYMQAQIDLAPGDRLLLFTDGVTDIQDTNGNDFGEDRLVDLLRTNRELGAVELKEKVIEAITTFGGGEFQDDVTLVLLAVR